MSELALPPIQQADLSTDDVRALLDDVVAGATLLGHGIKGGERTCATDAAGTLADDGALLLQGAVVGLQIRYRHDGREWWDTLMARPDGRFRLVRIEQRWAEDDVADTSVGMTEIIGKR